MMDCFRPLFVGVLSTVVVDPPSGTNAAFPQLIRTVAIKDESGKRADQCTGNDLNGSFLTAFIVLKILRKMYLHLPSEVYLSI